MAETNYKLLLQYDGRPFCGWQRQLNGPSVQATIEDVLARIWGKRLVLHGSGRTDAGVHARGQVANFKAEERLSPEELKRALNAELPLQIRVRSAVRAPLDFHSQYSAVEKTYRYLLQSSSVRSPFLPFYVHWSSHIYSLELMLTGAEHFIGRHDFAAMMTSGSSVKTTERTVTCCEIRHHNGLFSFTVTANGFLRTMVRSMTGLLMDVGRGKFKPDEVAAILKSRDRRNAGITAPAEGLTLHNVRYT